MEATREIYWNVGSGVIAPMYLLALAASGFMLWGFVRRVPIWRQGKDVDRLDSLGTRLRKTLREILGQANVYRVKESGIAHAIFFWGFFTLLIGTLLVMLQADFLTPLLNVSLLSGGFYKAFSLVLDLAGIASLAMVTGLIFRRLTTTCESDKGDYVVLLLLCAIFTSGFIVEGIRMAATELKRAPDLALFSPVGLLVAQPLLNIRPDDLRVMHTSFWWFHFILTLCFICAIPYTKLRHMFTICANTFFAPLEPKGAIATIDLEDTNATQFGAATITDLSWKDIFDADACVSCNRCQDRCPAYATEKPLSPLNVIKQIGELAETNPSGNLIDAVTQDAIWSCTTCGACQDICPANIEHVNKIIEMRRNLTLMEGAFPGGEVRTAVTNIEINGNPFGLAYATRGDWAKELPVTIMESGEPVDILYFVGCYASFDARNRRVASDFITICRAAGIKVGILGKEEQCCGEPARKLGNEYLYQMTAAKNIERLQHYDVKKIVTTCPHCCNTLGRDYKDLGLDIPVEHYSTFINGLITEKRLNMRPDVEPFAFTYHDSCYMGRYMDIFEEPRNALKTAGGQLSEMSNYGSDSFCCGAGGGRILCEEKRGNKINIERVKMAELTGVPLLVSNCPFCLTMFEDGIKTGGYENSLVVKDLAEIIAAQIAADR